MYIYYAWLKSCQNFGGWSRIFLHAGRVQFKVSLKLTIVKFFYPLVLKVTIYMVKIRCFYCVWMSQNH